MRSRSLLLFAALLVLPGCWLTQNQTATGEYARAVMVAQQRSSVLEHSVIETQARLKHLEQALLQAGQSEAKRLENIEEVNVEVNRLRGEIEQIRHALEVLKISTDDSLMDFERRQLYDEIRLEQLEGFLGVEPPPPPVDAIDQALVNKACEEGQVCEAPCETGEECAVPCEAGEDCAVEVAPSDEEVVPDDVAGKLALAKSHLEDGRYRVARAILEGALVSDHAAPELPEVRYRLGQTWMEEQSWAKAVSVFQSVLDNHERSDWAAWAMVRQGDCFNEMGQPENATLFFEEVQRLYPRSAATKDAKAKLKN